MLKSTVLDLLITEKSLLIVIFYFKSFLSVYKSFNCNFLVKEATLFLDFGKSGLIILAENPLIPPAAENPVSNC